MGERLPCTEEVRGSNPLISTRSAERRLDKVSGWYDAYADEKQRMIELKSS